MNRVPLSELKARMGKFREVMDLRKPDWEVAVIFSKIHMYYFTGTMQNGMLYIPRGDEATLFIYRSYERAVDESLFPCIRPMASYRVAKGEIGSVPEVAYVETEIVPMGFIKRFQNYFPFKGFEALDLVLAELRAVKSEYELDCVRRAGGIHQRVLEQRVPGILYEGMSEADLACKIYTMFMEEGFHGVTRLGMFDHEMQLGYVGFGENSIYPTNFNGPGGNVGISPAAPLFGSPSRKLKKGDLIFVDIGCGVEGYHTDRTMTYSFLEEQADNVVREHYECVRIQDEVVKLLKPGAIPSQIYKSVMEGLREEFLVNFMGFGKHKVNFLGHSIGLWVDETPVIAKGFDEPIVEGMVFAIEPKKGIEGVGMVGIENTFIVGKEGCTCITGQHRGLMRI